MAPIGAAGKRRTTVVITMTSASAATIATIARICADSTSRGWCLPAAVGRSANRLGPLLRFLAIDGLRAGARSVTGDAVTTAAGASLLLTSLG